MDLQKLQTNISAIISSWDADTEQFIDSFDPDFIDINQDQLLAGQDATGQSMPEYRSEAYARYKRAKGSTSRGLWDLKDSGDFMSAMDIDQSGNIFSRDSKERKLKAATESVGLDIFGIQPKRMVTFAKEQIEPSYKDYLINKITKE